MNASSHLVVNSPIEHRGSVLGRVVAGKSCLEILANINRVMVLERAITEVRAELAALRSRPHCDFLALHSLSEFKPYRPYSNSTRKKVANDEPLFAKGKGTWKPVVKHKTLGLGTFLRIVKNNSGLPALVVQFVSGEHTIPTFWATEKIEKRIEKWWSRLLRKEEGFEPVSPLNMVALTVGEMSLLPTVLKPINDSVELHQLREAENKEWERRRLLGLDDGLARERAAKNWDATREMYVHDNWEASEGSHSSRELKSRSEKLLADQYAENALAVDNRPIRVTARPILTEIEDGVLGWCIGLPKDLRVVAEEFYPVMREVRCANAAMYLAAFRRWLIVQKMSRNGHSILHTGTRSFESILRQQYPRMNLVKQLQKENERWLAQPSSYK